MLNDLDIVVNSEEHLVVPLTLLMVVQVFVQVNEVFRWLLIPLPFIDDLLEHQERVVRDALQDRFKSPIDLISVFICTRWHDDRLTRTYIAMHHTTYVRLIMHLRLRFLTI